jgi:hypothetical protein
VPSARFATNAMQYVQPNILSGLRFNQPFVSMLTIVDGPAGYQFTPGNQSCRPTMIGGHCARDKRGALEDAMALVLCLQLEL